MGIKEKIKSFALGEAGFDLFGVSALPLPGLHEKSLIRWLHSGYSGAMEYMQRSPERRANPEKILSSAKSVISLGVNYFHPEDPRPEGGVHGKISKYAYGRDYHQVLEKKLKKLSRFVLETGGPATQIKSYVDTGPVLEKAVAQSAGLGFFGKNTNIISKDFGSWIFLASVITNLELEADKPHAGSCGSCRICIDACPTDALLGNYTLDARRCISYLTIESKEETPNEFKTGIGEWAFGCDICQDVCPYNFKAKTTGHHELYPEKRAGTWLDCAEIQAQDFQGSPLKRAKLQGLRRNTETVLVNHKLRAPSS